MEQKRNLNAANYSNANSNSNLNSNSNNSKFKIILRQELTDYTPICGLQCAVIFNVSIFVLFLAFGAPWLSSAYSVIEYSVDYTSCNQTTCDARMEIKKTIQPPVYLYYALTNFHINHRDFVKSRSYAQLRGVNDSSNYSNCQGAWTVEEIFDYNPARYHTPWGKPLAANSLANPCGLAAKSFFNDTYVMYDNKTNPITIQESGIANDFDVASMFKRNQNFTSVQWLDVEDPHFIVWMQMESFSDFRKLWGKINTTLYAGTYTFKIYNNYNVTQYEGTKSIVISSSAALGYSSIIGWFLISASVLTLGLIILLLVLYCIKGNPLTDYQRLSWGGESKPQEHFPPQKVQQKQSS